MSRVGDYRIGLQERPEYQDGRCAADRGEIRHCFVLTGDARDAWLLGYDDAVSDRVSP